MKPLLLKAITKNQILLLNEIEKNSSKTITALVSKISRNTKIPLSTLKLSARMLKTLGLVVYDKFNPVNLSENGNLVLSIIRGELK